MSKKLTLTDRYIKSPLRVTEAKASKDGRFEVRDADCRNLRVRFSETGYHSFVLVKRFPPSPSPTRRTIGACDTITLAEARDTAVQWRRLISQDIDPKAQARAAKAAVAIAEAAAKAEAQRIKSTAFNAVCEVYINEHVNGLAHWHEITAMVQIPRGPDRRYAYCRSHAKAMRGGGQGGQGTRCRQQDRHRRLGPGTAALRPAAASVQMGHAYARVPRAGLG